MVALSSSPTVPGTPSGRTSNRTGENATASTRVAQRSWVISAVRPVLAVAAKRSASSVGSGAPAFGGCELRRSARMVRPSPTNSVSSASHFACSPSTRALRPSRKRCARARLSSSRAAVSAATTTVRISRRSISSIPANAASALSRHSAARRRGISCSANATKLSARTSGWPSARAASFCLSMA